MENAIKFREKLRRGQVCIAVHISCTDPTITEALCSVADVEMTMNIAVHMANTVPTITSARVIA